MESKYYFNPIDWEIEKSVKYYSKASEIINQVANGERQARLEVLLEQDRQNRFETCLDSFIPDTRTAEIASLWNHIKAYRSSGGYIIITGEEGQGKTSLIAKIMELCLGPGNEVYYFIPFIPDPNFQITLLHSLMAKLALKHPYLSDLWTETYNLESLAGSFSRMLEAISTRGDREVIFIAGINQSSTKKPLLEELFSILPTHLPTGIVIVIGTTFINLKGVAHKYTPLFWYQLPGYSLEDFEEMLLKRNITDFDNTDAESLRTALDGKPLYLNLLSLELAKPNQLPKESIMQLIKANPNRIFEIGLARLQSWSEGWESVCKPVLGLLLATAETRPLQLKELHQLLEEQGSITERLLEEGLTRMEGLVEHDAEKRYRLCHGEFIKYLISKEVAGNTVEPHVNGTWNPIFNNADISGYHKLLANWCKKELSSYKAGRGLERKSRELENRHIYALKYFLFHLFNAGETQLLWNALDTENFGKEKLLMKVNNPSFVQDLELGQNSVSKGNWDFSKNLEMLPYLWRYTLLRNALLEIAENLPIELFGTLVKVGQERKALGLAEAILDPEKKVEALRKIAGELEKKFERHEEARNILIRACEITHNIKNNYKRVVVLRELALALDETEVWEKAQEIWAEIESLARCSGYNEKQAKERWALLDLLKEQELLTQMEDITHTTERAWHRAWAINQIAEELAAEENLESAKKVWAKAEAIVQKLDSRWHRIWALCKIARSYASVKQINRADELLNLAKNEAKSIHSEVERAWAYSKVALGHFEAKQEEPGGKLWAEAEELALSIEDSWKKTYDLIFLSASLSKAQEWEAAREIALAIEPTLQQAWALNKIAQRLVKANEWEKAETLWAEAGRVVKEKDYACYQAIELTALSAELAKDKKWERAKATALNIRQDNWRTEALTEVAFEMVSNQEWKQTETLAGIIEDKHDRAWIYKKIVEGLVSAGIKEEALKVVERVWLQADSEDFATQLLPLVKPLLPFKPEIGEIFVDSFAWCDNFLFNLQKETLILNI